MNNKFLTTLLVTTSLVVYSGCSSKDEKEEVATPVGDDLGMSDALVFEGQSEDEFFATSEDAGLFDNEAPAAALGEVDPLAESAPFPETESFSDEGGFAAVDPGADPFLSEAAPMDPMTEGSDPFAAPEMDPFAAETGSDPFASVDPMVAEEPVPSEPSAPLGDGFFEDPAPSTELAGTTSTMDSSGFSDESERKLVPVVKIKDTPFRRAGQLMNAVYIVRPDDTLQSVSQKLFGNDQSDQILAANPHLNRSFKPGDKLYYNSPQRPNDDSQILTFYQDQGMPAETYVSEDGDNIRKVSSRLLGFDSAWKEVWATNPDVESKWLLNSGVQLKYWKGDGAPKAPIMAKSNELAKKAPKTPEPAFDEPEEVASFDEPEFDEPSLPEPPAATPPPVDMAGNMPPQDEFAEPQMADVDSLPPPDMDGFEEPTDDLAMNSLPPPPPPPPPPAFKEQGPASVDEAQEVAAADSEDPMAALTNMDDDMTMLVGVLAVIVLGAGAVVMIRRKKAKELELEDALSDHTQVG